MGMIYKHYQPKDIQIFIGTPLSSLFFKEIMPVQIGKFQPPTSPNLRLYETPLMKGKIILGGKLKINVELTPSFLMVHRIHFKLLRNIKRSSLDKKVLSPKNEHLSLEDFIKIEERGS